ncbi:MAG: hypothetical protein Q9225_003245 [Loekoesia sp. 1 TL-2023]
MADPFSAIGTAIRVAEFCFRFKEVSSENRVFLNLIVRVRTDLEEALRERQAKAISLQCIPEKRAWIDGAIRDAQQQLSDIGRLVEDARIDEQQGKTVSFKHRIDWVLTNHQRFVTQERALATSHTSLLAAMAVLHNLTAPANPTPITAPSSPPAYEMSLDQKPDNVPDDAVLRSPFTRRPGRAMSEKTSDSQLAPLDNVKTTSSLSLPEMESILEDSWTDSLLRLSLEDHDQRPKIPHVRSDNSISMLLLQVANLNA